MVQDKRALSIRVRKEVYDKILERATNNFRSINKEVELMLEQALGV